MTDVLGIPRGSGVGRSDEVDQASRSEDIERETVRKDVQVAAHHDEVVGLADRLDQRDQALGLVKTSRGITLSSRVPKAVQMGDDDVPLAKPIEQPREMGDARAVGEGPLVVLEVLPVDEAGALFDDADVSVHERRDPEVLDVTTALGVTHRARVTRDEHTPVFG